MNVEKSCELMEFLISNLQGKSRNNIKSLLKYKQVKVNGVPVSQFNYKLNIGDVVEISKYRNDDDLEVLYEDEYLLAINKPANVLSVRNNKGEYSAISMIYKYLQKSTVNPDVYVLHRLDKATSGVFVVAKNEKVQKQMQDNWNEVVTFRGYYALVEGDDFKSGRIESKLTENKEGLVYSTEGEGKLAITNYKVMKRNKGCSLLDVNIETGRKNQIRAHLKELGHPILGDLKYGKKSPFISRLALHSYRLVFTHPITNKRLDIKCDMPKEFKVI